MATSRENRISQILDELGRGSSLGHALSLIADQLAADIGAPTCKVWVVKRGDICDRCPLADSCSNRQMCMHLIAASGAAIDREYPRIPLSVFSAPMISRGGIADFKDSPGAGDKLFGLQRSSPSQSSDSYAIYPLRGTSGTVGLVGVFNQRPFRQEELSAIESLAPAAVAAIRVAELQSRCTALRARLEKETAAAAQLQQSPTPREAELEDAIAELTGQVAQLHVAREALLRAEARLEEQNRELQTHSAMLAAAQQESGQAASAMAYETESQVRQLEEENAQLKGRLTAFEAAAGEQGKAREKVSEELIESNQQLEHLKAHLSSLQERNSALEVTNVMLRGENASVAESMNDLEQSLRMAEDARARLEQANLALEENSRGLGEERDHYKIEGSRAAGENEQLVAEIERLNAEIVRLQGGGTRISEDNTRLLVLNAELAQSQSHAQSRVEELERERESLNSQREEARLLVEQENALLVQTRTQLEGEAARHASRAAELERENASLDEIRVQFEGDRERRVSLERENAALLDANTQLQHAVAQFESVSARLEDTAVKLRSRAEASEAARADVEQRNRVLSEQNRRLSLEGQTKARFLANMSHELRTPMNAIIGFTSLLLDDRALQLSDRHRRSLERVSLNARDLLELINNVLDLSKIEAGRMDVYSEPADARDLIERALAIVEPLKEGRPLKLSYSVEDGLPAMRTDRTKVQQVLINLLSNAVKFTNEGEVTVTAERSKLDRIRIVVSDTGIGIPESDLGKIFEEFRQVGTAGRGARSGTGLGLAITSRLVDLLGGEISVLSREGEGSIFAVTLPFEIEGRVASPIDSEIPLTDPERTALVIDSDPASLYLTKKYLTEAGYSVAATDDPERGVEIASKARPAVVTIDLDGTDDVSGVIGRIVKDHTDGVIVVFAADPAAEARAVNAGASLFLRKPVERGALIGLLERAKTPERRRVLVVDDDPDALDLAVAMIEDAGYEIETAINGREAMEAVARQRPDAIVLDLMLPEMDGFEVVHRLSLNPELRNIPVILLTARDLSHEERRALDIGTARIIQKGSFSRDELLAELSVVIGAGKTAALSSAGD